MRKETYETKANKKKSSEDKRKQSRSLRKVEASLIENFAADHFSHAIFILAVGICYI